MPLVGRALTLAFCAALLVIVLMLQDHLLAVKARMQASLQTAVNHENEDGNKRLATKQVGISVTVGAP